MPDLKLDAPLDLSLFDTSDPVVPAQALVPVSPAALPVAADPRLAPEPLRPRLVDTATLPPAEIAAAEQAAAKVDFRNTTTLLAHGDGVLAGIAQASRQLLAGVRLADAGEVGRIAAAVIDGIKILRIEDLQAEAAASRSPARPGGPADRAWPPTPTPPSRASPRAASNSWS